MTADTWPTRQPMLGFHLDMAVVFNADSFAEKIPGRFETAFLGVAAVPGATELFHGLWRREAALSKGPCLIERIQIGNPLH